MLTPLRYLVPSMKDSKANFMEPARNYGKYNVSGLREKNTGDLSYTSR